MHSNQGVYVACMDVGDFVIICTRNKFIPCILLLETSAHASDNNCTLQIILGLKLYGNLFYAKLYTVIEPSVF